MADVQVMGLPKSLKKSDIVTLFRNVLFRRRLKGKFWINNIYPLPNSNYIQVCLNITKMADANLAVGLINDFSYFNGKKNYQLSAVIVDKNESNVFVPPIKEETNKQKRQIIRDKAIRGSKKSIWSSSVNERSRSPHFEDNPVRIEMEIDLVRRQRLLVEEERKLLLEKKKLELLRGFVPSSVQHLKRYAAAIEKHTLEDTDPQKPEKFVTKSTTATVGLPLFLLPCRRIVGEMKSVLSEITNVSEKDKLLESLRVTLRKRIAELLQGQSFMHSGQIHKLYRETYPVETDQKLLEQIKAEFDVPEKVAEETSNIKEIVDNVQAKTEDKLLTENSNPVIIEVKTEPTMEKNDVNYAKVLVKDEILETMSAVQFGEIKSEEQTTASDTEHITYDLNDELDDWLDEDKSKDDNAEVQESLLKEKEKEIKQEEV